MNYRHAFHAGNFADVMKHVTLIALVDALQRKPAPICLIDTHAGRGLYDLRSEEAGKTGEHEAGVQRLLHGELPTEIARYVDLVRACSNAQRTEPADAETPASSIVFYPGSPLLAQALLREQDRAILCELQTGEAAPLKQALGRDPRIAVHRRDGYEALGALLPPAQKRGLVLIDPPFEAQAAEYAAIQSALAAAFARWPNAIYAVWYPIKTRTPIAPFHRWLRTHAPADAIALELLLHPDASPLRLNGSGLAIVNPPFGFADAAATWLPVLAHRLARDDTPQTRIEVLKAG